MARPEELHVQLDQPLPAAVEVGAGTAVFVCGWCFSPHARTRALELLVDGRPQPLMAHGMPRGDVFGALHPSLESLDAVRLTRDPDSPDDPELRSFRSGFWGLARIAPGSAEASCRLELRAELEDGSTARAELGTLELVSAPVAPIPLEEPEPGVGPLVAICMATHEPPPELLRRQLDSIRAQTHRNWVCVISDDCSSPERLARSRGRGRGRSPLRGVALVETARLLPELRARPRARAAGGGVHRPVRPGRPLAHRQA